MDNYQPYFKTGELIAKYLRNELNEAEKIEFEQWLNADGRNLELLNKILDEDFTNRGIGIFSIAEKEEAWDNILKNTVHKKSPVKWLTLKQMYPYAAAVFLLFAAGVFLSKFLPLKVQKKTIAYHKPDILPGTNKAVLTLANGSKIVLNNAAQGNIANQRNVVIKVQNSRVIYQITAGALKIRQPEFKKLTAMNTLTTPRGGQYGAVLPDGTRVWLNASSSLTYPVEFPKSERYVELTGEAYFEVAKKAASPFRVTTATQTVEVLGTHFNINSYGDENAVKTTLLEGSVKVTENDGAETAKLKPGQQAVNNQGKLNVINEADIEEAMAWKNGKFLFRDTDLPGVMRQLSRWYDVDVEYQGVIRPKHYHGRISKNVPVSQVFEILKTSGVNFIINGRTIIVKE